MTTILKTAQSELVHSSNPLQKTIKFVFADDQPDGNNRVLDHSEFANVMRTAIGMPIKMKFDGAGVGEHEGAIPVGAITGMHEDEVEGVHRLIAEASLWADEYPEEIEWLVKAYADKRAPGFSYELVYEDSEHVSGLERIKNVITGAAAMVRVPAFGNRTPLLALAELTVKNPERADEIINLITEAFDTKAKGGNSMDEKELEQLQAKAALVESLQAQVAEAASKDSVIEDLNKQLAKKDEDLTAANDTIASMQRDNLLNARVQKYVEAGFTLEAEAEKADARKNLFASLSDDQFEAYIADLVAIKPKESQLAVASLKRATPQVEVPKLEGTGAGTDLSTLRAEMRNLARPNSAE